MSSRPNITLSVASSLDGYIDDGTPKRLELSNQADWEEVDRLRAESDAILVGANTVRRDWPKLLVKGDRFRAERLKAGKSENPWKVTITKSGSLDPASPFFSLGDTRKLVLCPNDMGRELGAKLAGVAEVIPCEVSDLGAVLSTLTGLGVRKLMVEGGAKVLAQFIASASFDRLRIAWAPIFVADPAGVRMLHGGASLAGLSLDKCEQLGDMVIAWYRPK